MGVRSATEIAIENPPWVDRLPRIGEAISTGRPNRPPNRDLERKDATGGEMKMQPPPPLIT